MTTYRQTWTDSDDIELDLSAYSEDGEVLLSTSGSSCLLTREQVLQVYHVLGNHLMATTPEVELTRVVEPSPPEATTGGPLGETITAEAERAVYGDRQDDYGHPRADFTRTAVLWQGLLMHKLAEGESMTPEDVARCMIAVKLARDVHAPKRDNRVDGAGFFLCLDRLETGR